ncbi:MAG: hypothetical protein A3H23_05385 [Planctomycetes bacterium RIFCSPLOWO2_12_FULL_40_19]|nr:MAG: hypothetical protein A3H23_05385 [Planctomycetes bacterium RIFCSPLOWO2_12_FULL_40_19]
MLAEKEYTVIMRKSKLEYVAICLELNVSASGVDLADAERNLKDAIEIYLEDINEYPETVAEPITVKELIEFLRDTEPEWHGKSGDVLYFRPFEVHEVPVYV